MCAIRFAFRARFHCSIWFGKRQIKTMSDCSIRILNTMPILVMDSPKILSLYLSLTLSLSPSLSFSLSLSLSLSLCAVNRINKDCLMTGLDVSMGTVTCGLLPGDVEFLVLRIPCGTIFVAKFGPSMTTFPECKL